MKFNLKIIRRLNVVAAGGLCGMYFIENLYYLNTVKNALELKISGAPAPVSRKLKILVEDVMNDMALSSEDRSLVKLFIVNDFNVKHLGHLSKNFGAFLGVPQHFILDRTTDFEVIPMMGDTPLSSDSPEAWNFKTFLSLSAEAKKFAIARELYEAKNIYFYYLGLLPLFVFLCGNAISITSEKLLRSSQRPLPYFHAFIFLMTTWFYVLLNDILSVNRQAESDRSVAKLGSSYIQGGIEYYEKLLKRNKNLKKLNKFAPYTESGENMKHMGFRTITMPFSSRIDLLKDLKKKQIF